MRTISVLGSGWLGLPMARHFIVAGNKVKASTTSEDHLAELEAIGAEPFVVNVDSLGDDVQHFLQADILIVNIPSKNITGFHNLMGEIERSQVKNVLFVSSTSVYQDINKTITESDDKAFSNSPLLAIEELFQRWNGPGVTIVRFGGLIGNGRHPGRFFRPGRVIRNPDAPVNLIHADDCIGILSQVIEQNAWGEVFNCCADTHPTRKAFYSQACELLGCAPPQFGETDSRLGKTISNEKVKRILGYAFEHPDLMQIQEF